MAKAKTILCGPCEYENEMSQAIKWCTECQEGYCKICLRVHKATRVSRNHHIISIADYESRDEFYTENIRKEHNKELGFFCPGHDVVVCVLCVQLNHSKCLDLMSLVEASKGAKSSTAVSDLELRIDAVIENISHGKNTIKDEEDSIDNQEKAILETITTTHKEINRHFDRLEEKTIRDLKEQKHNCKLQLSCLTEKIYEREKDIHNLKEKVIAMKQFGSDLQTFIDSRKYIQSVYETEVAVRTDATNIPSFDFSNKLNPITEDILTNMHKFAEVNVTEKFNTKPFLDTRAEQAQKVSNIDSIEIERQLAIRMEDTVRSGFILPDNQLIFIEEEPSLVLYSDEGQFLRKIAVSEFVCDLTIIDNKTVAVTFLFLPDAKAIAFIDIPAGVEEKKIKIGCKNWLRSIVHYNNNLYVEDYGTEIKIVSLNGTAICCIPAVIISQNCLAISPTNIHFVAPDNTVHCVDMNGQTKWIYKFKNIEEQDMSITRDKNGNIFALFKHKEILIALSKDGKQEKVLLTKTDNLINPTAIYCKDNCNLILICNNGGHQANLYHVVNK